MKLEKSLSSVVIVVALASALPMLPITAFATEKHWLGTDATSPTLASVGANWSPAGVPTSADDVVLDSGSNNNPMTWDLDNGVRSWMQSDYTGTVTFKTGATYGSYTCYGVLQADGTRALEISGNLTLSSGTWTHEQTPTMTSTMKTQDLYKKGFGIYRLIVKVGGDCTIGAAATINVDGKGFPASSGPGYRSDGSASHGGFGGKNYDPETNPVYVYGSTKAPVSIGSGRTTAGGGAVKLSVVGTLTLDGEITAISPKTGLYPGSGGSVWILAASLAGAGSVSVDGGSGTGSGSGSGSGGGGRAAVYLTGDGSDFSYFTGRITAENTSNYGTCGTVYLETAADDGAGRLVLACGTNASPSHKLGTVTGLCTPLKVDDSPDFRFSEVKLDNWSNLGIMPNVTATVVSVSAAQTGRNFITLYGGALKFDGTGGDFALSGATLRTYTAASHISVGAADEGAFNLASGASLILNVPTTIGGKLVASGAVRLGADVTVTDFQLPAGATIYLDGNKLKVTDPGKSKSQSILGTVDMGDGGEIVWGRRALVIIVR